MLPPFIIEQIRQREEQERRRHERQQPRLELPLDMPVRRPRKEEEVPAEEQDRGVTILDLG